MRKILLIAAVFSFSLFRASSQVKFGFNAGISVSNAVSRDKEENETEISDPIAGLNIGFVTTVPIGKNFSFAPGLNFVQKGAKQSESYESLGAETITINWQGRLSCLELQLPILYNTNGEKGKFFLGAGPTLSYAISGKSKLKITGEEQEDRKLDFGNSNEDDLRPFDIGANVLIGYMINKGFVVSANYNMGLLNLTPGDDAKDMSNRFDYYSLKIGWMIGK
ncbi:porin family protein [Lacibacter sediminis]|uniref:PorT family protein n=1 Tax=Lacibacter sediminis TaxID=2760713 RepID=A0A7G5XBH8_9BACT|nr:porin family protein [Lacibacter sediminis]QNA42831.1 PorT family protein [Lacibacter sediminis]